MDILKVKQNGVWTAIPAIIGPRGIGITSITKTGTSGLTDTYTITFSDNTTTTFTLNNGAVPNLTIGTVTEGATAAATITGTTDAPVLNLVLPNANVPTRVSELENDAGYLTSYTETDPTVPAWAKAAQKPTYTAAEVGAPTVAEMNQAIANVNTMKIHICAQGEYNAETGVPTIQNPDTQTFYLVPGGEGSNLFIEWAYVNSAWERFGSADIDLSNYVQKTDYATTSDAGVVKIPSDAGLSMFAGQYLMIAPALISRIKASSSSASPITTGVQHMSVFYGLAKAAGDTTQSQSDNEVGTYTNEAKTAIQTMLDVPAKSDIPDTSIYATKADTVLTTTLSLRRKTGTTIGENSIALGYNTEASGAGSVAIGNRTQSTSLYSTSFGCGTIANIGTMTAIGMYNAPASEYPQWVAGTHYNVGDCVIAPVLIGQEIFDLPRKCLIENNDTSFDDNKWGIVPAMKTGSIAFTVGNGTTPSARSNAYALDWDGNGHYMGDVYVHSNADSSGGTKVATVADIPDVPVTDVQVNGTSVVTSGIANVPIANAIGNYGIMRIANNYSGLAITSTGGLYLVPATDYQVKDGSDTISPVTPVRQHSSTFFGLAKAAGDTTQKASSNAVGTYTDEAKAAIKTMLGVQDGLKVVRLI